MHIMTANGWMPLEPKNITRLAPPDGVEPYIGPIPSAACLAYVAKLKREHQEWVARRAAMHAE